MDGERTLWPLAVRPQEQLKLQPQEQDGRREPLLCSGREQEPLPEVHRRDRRAEASEA
jgi:hypothetical protein